MPDRYDDNQLFHKLPFQTRVLTLISRVDHEKWIYQVERKEYWKADVWELVFRHDGSSTIFPEVVSSMTEYLRNKGV